MYKCLERSDKYASLHYFNLKRRKSNFPSMAKKKKYTFAFSSGKINSAEL